MDKIAIIELNELGLKLSILEVCDGGYYNVLDKISENIKLGSSVQNENIIPSAKPVTGASHGICPCACAEFIAGIISDHTVAANITPAANPSNPFSTDSFMPSFIKNTIIAPSVVPAKGTISDISSVILIHHHLYYNTRAAF